MDIRFVDLARSEVDTLRRLFEEPPLTDTLAWHIAVKHQLFALIALIEPDLILEDK